MRRRLGVLPFAHAAGELSWAKESINYVFHLGDLRLLSIVEENFDETVQDPVFLFLFNNTIFDVDSVNFSSDVIGLGVDWDLVRLNIHLDCFFNIGFLAVFVVEWCNFIFAQIQLEVSKIHIHYLL